MEADLAAPRRRLPACGVADPVVQLRRLVIGEANRLPELAGSTTNTHRCAHSLHSPKHSEAARQRCLERSRTLACRRAFRVSDRWQADRPGPFRRCAKRVADFDVDAYARAGVEIFLAAYRPR